jgi:hypothetical protein
VVVDIPPDTFFSSASVSVNGTLMGRVTAENWTITVDPVAIGASFGDDLFITVVADGGSGLEETIRVVYLPP